MKWGSPGTGDGQFDRPIGIAIDQGNNVLVSEMDNHRIQKFTGEGVFLTKWGSLGSGDGQFQSPFGLEMDMTSGCLYIVEWIGNNVHKYGPAPSSAGPGTWGRIKAIYR